MAENKTKYTDASVEDYIASRANAQQRSDCRELMALFKKITRQPPRNRAPALSVMDPSGTPTRVDEPGEAPLAAFAIRGRELVVYLDAEGAAGKEQRSLLSRLGKHRMLSLACTSSS